MLRVKESLIAFAGFLVLIGAMSALMPLAGHGQGGNPHDRDPRRQFYLTKTVHDGGHALSACAEGYHMASLLEILDVSNLKYNTELGRTAGDSGSGPPRGNGRVRTGVDANASSNAPGFANCNAWTSTDQNDAGATAHLELSDPGGFEIFLAPWLVGASNCSTSFPVWCMQD